MKYFHDEAPETTVKQITWIANALYLRNQDTNNYGPLQFMGDIASQTIIYGTCIPSALVPVAPDIRKANILYLYHQDTGGFCAICLAGPDNAPYPIFSAPFIPGDDSLPYVSYLSLYNQTTTLYVTVQTAFNPPAFVW